MWQRRAGGVMGRAYGTVLDHDRESCGAEMHAPVGFVAEEVRGQHGVDVGVDRHRVRWLNLINLALPPIDALVQEKSSLERLARWRAMPEPDPRSTLEAARLIVVDIESTGLDPNADRLRAIGAMTVQGEKIHLGRSIQATLGEPGSSQRNGTLLDGTGIVSERDAMLAFLEFAGKAPLVGYNVAFVDGMIRRAAAQHLGEYYRPRWIDLADLARQLVPDQARRRTSLDTWLDRFGIEVFSRHDAVAGALARAQLLLAVLGRAKIKPRRVEELLWQPGAARWLSLGG